MLLKTSVVMVYLFSSVEPELIYFVQLVLQLQTVASGFKSSNGNANGIWKYDEYRNYYVLTDSSWICLGLALDLSNIDLLDIDLSDAE